MEAAEGAWHTFGDIAFYACAVAALIFCLLYLLLAPWWRTKAGRNIMSVMGTLAVAMVYFGWVIASDGVPNGFWPVRAILFTCMFLSITWRVILLVREQILVRKEGNDREHQPLG